MATAVAQLIDENYSEEGNKMTLIQFYKITGASTTYAASVAGGLPRRGMYYLGTPMICNSMKINRWGRREDLYKATVRYEVTWSHSQKNVEEGDEFWRYIFSTENAHIYSALSQTKYGSNAREVNNLIQVDDEGIPQGVDILAPSVQLEVVKYWGTNSITLSLLRNIQAELTKVYSGTGYFYGLRAGECIFLGTEVPEKRDSDELIPLTYKFGVSRNLSSSDLSGQYVDISTGSGISITGGKKGFEHIWTDAAGDADDDDGTTTFGCRGVYVDVVYETSSFSGLNLSGEL